MSTPPFGQNSAPQQGSYLPPQGYPGQPYPEQQQPYSQEPQGFSPQQFGGQQGFGPQQGFGQPSFNAPGGRPPGKGRLALILGVVAAVAIAAGVGVYFAVLRDGGDAETGAGGKGGGFDNLVSLDPCSYLQPKQFAEFADAGASSPMIRIEPSGFSTCDVELERSKAFGAGNTVTVHLEAGRMAQAELGKSTSTVQRGSLQVVTTSDAGQPKCQQYVFRADGVGVRLSVDTFSLKQSDSLDTLCKIRDAATNAVVDALDNNRADRITYPKDSIGGIDPCTRLETAEITAATKAASVTKFPAGPASECRWDTGDYRITVSSELMLESDPRAHGTDETIAGRTTVIEPSSKKPTCRASFYGRSWDPWLGSHSNYTEAYNDDVSKFVEVTRLYVQLPNTGTTTATDACQTVRTLAAAAWPRLPHN